MTPAQTARIASVWLYQADVRWFGVSRTRPWHPLWVFSGLPQCWRWVKDWLCGAGQVLLWYCNLESCFEWFGCYLAQSWLSISFVSARLGRKGGRLLRSGADALSHLGALGALVMNCQGGVGGLGPNCFLEKNGKQKPPPARATFGPAANSFNCHLAKTSNHLDGIHWAIFIQHAARDSPRPCFTSLSWVSKGRSESACHDDTCPDFTNLNAGQC